MTVLYEIKISANRGKFGITAAHLDEIIQGGKKAWIAASLTLLAMTAVFIGKML